MKRIAVIVVFLLLVVLPVDAQRICGNGVPCRSMPWDLPIMPHLISPTPFPTIFLSATPSPTDTPTPSDTPDVTATDTPTPTDTPIPTDTPTPTDTSTSVPSPTSFLDTTQMAGQVETLEAMLSATPFGISNPEGTPVDIDTLADDLAGDAGTLFDYIQGLTLANFGVLSPLILFIITGLGFTMLIKFAGLILPMIVLAFGFLRKIIQFVLDFIPG